ncbi:MAG: LysM peptidoglycan-binding domain-containing protein [Gemmatimonadota bacterium]
MAREVLLRTPSFLAIRPHYFLLTILALTTLTGCVGSGPAPSGPRPEASGLLLGEELRPVDDAILGAVDYDLPVEANSWVEAELQFLVTQRRDVVRSWIERGDFYADFVTSVLREQGVPTDLYHLAMIESGYVPVARSPVGAVGMWQFMPATSRDVGLRVDSSVDERMDPVRSTRAAARHLRSLHRIHGNWTLAAAAYNAGSGRINRGLARFGARDFWELAQKGDLAEETRRYVPRLFAMTIIGRDRERFGFGRAVDSAGFAFDSVHVEYSVPLDELGELGGVDPLTVVAMNPHLTGGMTPAGGYWVWVPSGTGPQVQRAYLASTMRGERDVAGYTVRWGDTLGDIALLAGISSARVRELNPGVDLDRLQTGVTVQLPAAAARRLSDRPFEVPEEERPTVATVVPRPEPVDDRPPPPSPAREPERPALSTAADAAAPETHTVEAGETLFGIARRYGSSVPAIQEANQLSGSVIVPGQRLLIPSGSDAMASGAPPVPAYTEHTVEAGETLTGIARRYGTSVVAVQEANGLSGSVIRPGQRLRIPSDAR